MSENVPSAAARDDETSKHRSEVWTRFPVIVRAMRRMNPGKRVPAELVTYDHLTRDGLVQLVLPRFGSLSFSEPETYVSGYLFKARDSRRPVWIDIRGFKGGQRKVSSVLATSKYFRELPSTGKRASTTAISEWMRKNPRLKRVGLGMVGLVVTSIIVGVLRLIGLPIPQPIVWFMGVLGAISLNLVSDAIYGYLSTRDPADFVTTSQ